MWGVSEEGEVQRPSQDGDGGRRNCSPESQFIEHELPSKPDPSLVPVNRPGGRSSWSCEDPTQSCQRLLGPRPTLKTEIRGSPTVMNL